MCKGPKTFLKFGHFTTKFENFNHFYVSETAILITIIKRHFLKNTLKR